MTFSINQGTLVALVISIFIHMLIMALRYDLEDFANKNNSSDALRIKTITYEDEPKLRKIGFKNANKNSGYRPDQKNQNKVAKSPTLLSDSKNEKLSLNQLKVSNTSISPEHYDFKDQEQVKNKAKEFSKFEIKAVENGRPITTLRSQGAQSSIKRQENMRYEFIKNLGTNSKEVEIISNSGFNMHIEPPEGIEEDELNTIEKIFYSFQRRIFTNYLNSFLTTYFKLRERHPNLEASVRGEEHLLTGKVTYDKEGNILSVKILRSSHNDNLHELFENTLRNINNLPNPPQALIEGKNQFSIYYQLHINGR